MIPAPLTTPVDLRPSAPPRRGWVLRWCGVAALVAAVAGAIVWVGAYSPLGYERFDVFEQGRQLSFRQGGTYTVYEEFDGASDPRLPTPIEVLVVGEDGRPVTVEPALAAGERGAPAAYHTPWHEGRALGTFEIDEGGSYRFEVAFLPGGPGRYRPFEQVTLAVARQPAAGWLRTWPGAALLVGLPAAIGVGCLLAARRTARARSGAG